MCYENKIGVVENNMQKIMTQTRIESIDRKNPRLTEVVRMWILRLAKDEMGTKKVGKEFKYIE